MDRMSATEFASALAHVERLAERGNQPRLPASRSLGVDDNEVQRARRAMNLCITEGHAVEEDS